MNNETDFFEHDIMFLNLYTGDNIADVVQCVPGLVHAGPAHGGHQLDHRHRGLGETLSSLFEAGDVVHQTLGSGTSNVL